MILELDHDISTTLVARDYKGPSADWFADSCQPKMILERPVPHNLDIPTLTKKAINHLEQYELIKYPVTMDHLVGFLGAQTGIFGREELDKVKPHLTILADDILSRPEFAFHRPTHKVEYYENHPKDSRVKGPKTIGNTVTAFYGMGGGNIPLVLEHQSYNITFNDANGTRKDRPNGGCYINETKTSNAITTGGVGDTRVIERSQSKSSKVRQLTPLECERLQGFPDNWTQIAYRKKSAKDCPKSPRYKALGNSMAVPVMRYIGVGILEVEERDDKNTSIHERKAD
jgi:site-specific DNA-cytosine methylase